MVRFYPTIRLVSQITDTASILEQIPADRSVKLVRILNNRVSDLREVIHEQLRHRWNSIVQLDSKERYLVINADPTGKLYVHGKYVNCLDII